MRRELLCLTVLSVARRFPDRRATLPWRQSEPIRRFEPRSFAVDFVAASDLGLAISAFEALSVSKPTSFIAFRLLEGSTAWPQIVGSLGAPKSFWSPAWAADTPSVAAATAAARYKVFMSLNLPLFRWAKPSAFSG